MSRERIAISSPIQTGLISQEMQTRQMGVAVVHSSLTAVADLIGWMTRGSKVNCKLGGS